MALNTAKISFWTPLEYDYPNGINNIMKLFMFSIRPYLNRIFVIFVLCISVSACGYRFTGGGNLPEGIKSICITMFENCTGEIGIESVFTNDIIHEFTRNSNVHLTSLEKAEAVLSGTVRSVNIETLSRDGQSAALERRVRLALDLKLADQEGKVVWSVKNVSGNEAYKVMSDRLATEHNRQEAISEISERLAESVYYQLTDNF
ncbi:MAG: hypothetical protein GY795_37085 [Desulfobacterales bacterium]|nr:hypothetical protein [Desulfobacterales bacterium]